MSRNSQEDLTPVELFGIAKVPHSARYVFVKAVSQGTELIAAYLSEPSSKRDALAALAAHLKGKYGLDNKGT